MADGNIRQFEAPGTGLQTNSAVSNAYENLARTQVVALGAAGNAIAGGIRAVGQPIQDAYERGVEQKEISTGAAAAAIFMQNLDQDWNELAKNSDPNDASIAGKFTSDLETKLAEFRLKFETEKGQKWADDFTNRLRDHFYQKTSADVASRARVAVAQNVTRVGNASANTVYSDPSSLDFVLGNVDATVDALLASSAGLDNVDAAALKETLTTQLKGDVVQAAMMGLANQNPKQFLADLKAGEYTQYMDLLSQEQQAQIETYGKVQESAQATDSAAAQRALEKEQMDNLSAKVVGVLGQGLQPDGSYALPANAMTTLFAELSRQPGADTNAGRELITSAMSAVRAQLNDQETGTKVSTIPEVYTDFRNRAFLPADNPRALTMQELLQARADRKISDKDFTVLKDAITDGRSNPEAVADNKYLNAFFEGYKSSVTESTVSLTDGPGDRRFFQFKQDMYARFAAGKAAKHSTSELLDPASPYFILGKGAKDLVQYTAANATYSEDDLDQIGGLITNQSSTLSKLEFGNDPLYDFLTEFYGNVGGDIVPAPRVEGETIEQFLARTAK